MNARTIIFGAVITVLAGCSLAPVYERPALPTDAAYPAAFAAQTQVTQDAMQLGCHTWSYSMPNAIVL